MSINNPNRCLICYSDKVSGGPSTSGGWSGVQPGSSNFSSPPPPGNFVQFILRNLLEVPEGKLGEFGRHSGSNAENWVKLCGNCSGVVYHANQLYQQLLHISKMFTDTKRSLIETVKRGPFQNPGGVVKDMVVTEESRRIASQIDLNKLVDRSQALCSSQYGSSSSTSAHMPSNSSSGMMGEYPPLSYFKALQDDLQIGNESSSSNNHGGGADKPKPFQCPKCPTSFTQKGNLTRHVENVHNKTHRFSCNLCGKFWTKNSDLKRHLSKVHHVSPPPTSKGGGNNQNNMWNHWMEPSTSSFNSTKARRGKSDHIKCDLCPVSFTQKGNLARHMETVHEGLAKFNCAPCGQRWAKNSDYKKHMARVHNTVHGPGIGAHHGHHGHHHLH